MRRSLRVSSVRGLGTAQGRGEHRLACAARRSRLTGLPVSRPAAHVVTDLLEAGEPEHVIEAITGHLSRRMLEHYSHQRLKAKDQMLTRMEERRKRASA